MTLYLSKNIFLLTFIKPLIILLKHLIFKILVSSLGRYVPMQQAEYVLWTVGGEGKTTYVYKISYHFNDLMRNQSFSALPSKIFHLSHSLDGNAHLSCKYMSQS